MVAVVDVSLGISVLVVVSTASQAQPSVAVGKVTVQVVGGEVPTVKPHAADPVPLMVPALPPQPLRVIAEAFMVT